MAVMCGLRIQELTLKSRTTESLPLSPSPFLFLFLSLSISLYLYAISLSFSLSFVLPTKYCTRAVLYLRYGRIQY